METSRVRFASPLVKQIVDECRRFSAVQWVLRNTETRDLEPGRPPRVVLAYCMPPHPKWSVSKNWLEMRNRLCASSPTSMREQRSRQSQEASGEPGRKAPGQTYSGTREVIRNGRNQVDVEIFCAETSPLLVKRYRIINAPAVQLFGTDGTLQTNLQGNRFTEAAMKSIFAAAAASAVPAAGASQNMSAKEENDTSMVKQMETWAGATTPMCSSWSSGEEVPMTSSAHFNALLAANCVDLAADDRLYRLAARAYLRLFDVSAASITNKNLDDFIKGRDPGRGIGTTTTLLQRLCRTLLDAHLPRVAFDERVGTRTSIWAALPDSFGGDKTKMSANRIHISDDEWLPAYIRALVVRSARRFRLGKLDIAWKDAVQACGLTLEHRYGADRSAFGHGLILPPSPFSTGSLFNPHLVDKGSARRVEDNLGRPTALALISTLAATGAYSPADMAAAAGKIGGMTKAVTPITRKYPRAKTAKGGTPAVRRGPSGKWLWLHAGWRPPWAKKNKYTPPEWAWRQQR